MDFNKIKLVIWDLDETLWNGTLSEGEVVLPKDNKNLILRLTDLGIVNSICSKKRKKQELLSVTPYSSEYTLRNPNFNK